MNEVSEVRLAGQLPLATTDEAAAIVKDGDTVAVSGFGGVGYPKAVPERLADREDLTVISAGGVGGEIDELLVESGAMTRRAHFQTRKTVRGAINAGEIDFFDRHVSAFGDDIRYGPGIDVDVAVVEAVAAGEGWFVPSTSIGHVPAIVEAANQLVLEVNHAQPIELATVHDVYERDPPPDRDPIPLSGAVDRIGTNRIAFDPDMLAAVVETDRPDDPYTFRDPTDADRQIAARLGAFLEGEMERSSRYDESLIIEFGVGSMGNALIGTLSSLEVGDRDVIYFGEVFQDGLIDMLDADTLAGASATSLALSSEGQDRFFASIDQYVEDVVLRPADISNNAALLERFGVVAVNSAIEVDLYGNANATHIGGTRMINGIGGGSDFTRHGRPGIIALPSTAADGEISRIVPLTPHVDHTEHDVSVVVTEHGLADLRGCTPRERAENLIEIADPRFRENLRSYLDRAETGGGQTPHDFETAFDWEE